VSLAEVYIDESGSHDRSPVLSVGGYVFEKNAAVEFDRDWKTALDAAELPYFRMSACAHLMEPFEKKTIDEADEIERALIKLTKEKALYGFVVSLSEEEYKSIGPKHEGLGSAYSFCLRQYLIAVRSWINSSGFTGKIAYFFESGHQHQGEAGVIMERVFKRPHLREEYRYSAHAFADKADARPLQAADLLAWQWNTDARRKRKGVRVTRKDLQLLYDHRINQWIGRRSG
jgi:Protein of unknown function (DUF3800)